MTLTKQNARTIGPGVYVLRSQVENTSAQLGFQEWADQISASADLDARKHLVAWIEGLDDRQVTAAAPT